MKYTGNCVSGGVAVGEAYIYTPFIPQIREDSITEQLIAETVANYQKAKESARNELERIQSSLSETNEEKAKIFTAHIDILCDIVIDEDITLCIT